MSSNVRKEFKKNLENSSKQTKELGNKLAELEKKLETTSKEFSNKLEELEKKLQSNFETTSTQTKELDNKLEEILKLLKH